MGACKNLGLNNASLSCRRCPQAKTTFDEVVEGIESWETYVKREQKTLLRETEYCAKRVLDVMTKLVAMGNTDVWFSFASSVCYVSSITARLSFETKQLQPA